jgi:hypothetical protein
MGPIARSTLAVLLLLSGAGCAGEVHYWGSVVAAPKPGYSFDAKENPDKLPPIRDADVRLCICTKPCPCTDDGRVVKADVGGHYELPTVMVSGASGADSYVVVRAEAEGFEAVTYTMSYDKRSAEDRAREPADGAKALNFRLGPGAR